jgi:signal transduction histidine kinase
MIHWSAARLLAAVSFAVVGCFIGANLYAQRETLAIDSNALALVDSIAPRIDHLTSLRGAIYRLDRAVRDAVAARSLVSEAENIAERERKVIAAELAQVRSAPRLRPALDAFEVEARRILALARAGDLPSPGMQIEALAQSVAVVDQVIHDLVVASASDAARDGARIERLRRHASAVAYSLNALATMLSLAMLAIALRITRQNERLVSDHDAAVEERNQLAERRAAELEAFAARVAHDLKNPIAAMGLRMTVLRRRNAAPPADLDRVEQTLQRLIKVIDGLLAFATSGGVPDRGASTRLLPVMKEVVDDVEMEAEHAAVDVQITNVDAWISVACPAAPLGTILENLVRNAVKYVTDGTGPTHVVVIRAERRHAIAHVEVEDNGPGVPAGEEAVIFEPYARGRGATRPGLGIGLATVKRLVEAYDGAVGVRSTAGAGSCFWFELPLGEPRT